MSVEGRLAAAERRFDALGLINGHVLRDVEIFRVGEWNGHNYTSTDLDAILAAFDPHGDFRPPVKLGHDDDPKAPAYGWVTSLRRDGDRLLADFADVPAELVEQIRQGRYGSVSVELFIGIRRNGRKLPLALKAVAVLGAHPPGVAGLRPLRDAVDAYA